MLQVAVLTGGDASERNISLKSATTIAHHLDKNRCQVRIIDLQGMRFIDQATDTVLDKNDFSLTLGALTIRFDVVVLYIHGHPAEDGQLQGYFQLLGIPTTGCDTFVSALTFNKQATKNYLLPYNIPMALSALLRVGKEQPDMTHLGLPLFVKPNKNGSSYGASLVKEAEDLAKAIELAFQYDDEVLVEQFMQGREFSNGVFRNGEEIVVLPITEIVTANGFFDYKAKYEHESQEITPADLTVEQTAVCQARSRELYERLGCRGFVRFDYILWNDDFHVLEANTIPGFSPQSLFPQQLAACGWTITDALNAMLDEAMVGK